MCRSNGKRNGSGQWAREVGEAPNNRSKNWGNHRPEAETANIVLLNKRIPRRINLSMAELIRLARKRAHKVC